MAKHTQTFFINFTGGIISPGYLQEVLEAAAVTGITHARFGLRQQLILEIPGEKVPAFLEACSKRQITPANTPNIISSYAAANIFIHNSWLSEGIYKDVFNLFDYTPDLKINICDSQQTFTPLFTGHLNWISSSSLHYWHLYVRLPGSQQLFAWPELIYTNNIAALSKKIEQLLPAALTAEKVYQQVCASNAYISKPNDTPLELPVFHLPYYEGFNKYNNHYWLGIYRRDETFPLALLKDICAICRETHTGQLYATSWKSLVIKGIDPVHRHLWDYTLGKYHINVRHAANELNWQVEDNSEDALVLKRHIIRYFDTADVRTYGLCFSIRIEKTASLFGSIVIRRQENKYGSKLKYMQRYDILYTPGYNANSSQLLLFRESVSKEHLGPYITALCKSYYEQNSAADILQQYVAAQQLQQQAPVRQKEIHQCVQCFTVYDPEAGDEEQHIAAGTAFAALPDTYTCSVCAAPLSCYKTISADHQENPL